MASPVITLLTDFGHQDPFVGIMKGVILRIHPVATVVDLTHGVPPQNVLAGALILKQAAPFFPPGSIHVAVVDPGVGSERRGLLVGTRTHFFVGPDNGLLSLAAPEEEVVWIVHLTNPRFFLSPLSRTFHGRDVFAPVAAYLSAGITPTDFGPQVATMERLCVPLPHQEKAKVVGEVVYTDHFGNLVTNIPEHALLPFPMDRLFVNIKQVQIRGLSFTYTAVTEGEFVAVVNSWGYLEIAVRNGSAARRAGGSLGEPVTVTLLEGGGTDATT